jgi:ComF family protein
MDIKKVDGWLARLFPKCCILCRQPSGALNCCAGCRGDMPWIRPSCNRCGGPLPTGFRGHSCARCTVPMRDVDQVLSALVYEFPIDRLITLAKFGARTDSAHALGELLGVYLLERKVEGLLDLPDLILPVPLHRRRLVRRGFNQALEIARPVATGLELALQTDLCVRDRNTLEQTRLTGPARYRNTRNAFRVTHDLSGLHVAVVDDVITTGSTVEAIACELKRAGATRIQAWSVARAIRIGV